MIGIGLHHIKDKMNLGSVMRAAGCYDANIVIMTGKRCSPGSSDTSGARNHIPLLQVEDLKSAIPHNYVPVAVDLIEGAQSLPEYTHPKNAFYIFGAEDNTLGKDITSWCRDIVYVPTKFCMNLAATVNVILYDRMAKRIKND
jgi:tRNA(Leu) C34 or U34 (ribose-2'-O)-methylase TrmL